MDNLIALFKDMNKKLEGKLTLEMEFSNTNKIVLIRESKKIFSVAAASINAAIDIAFSKLMDYKKEVLP